MSETLGVPQEMLMQVESFLREHGIPLEVTSGRNATVVVGRSSERRESGPATLQSGGWIACPTALGMAGRVRIRPQQLGMLLNLLDVKIKACSLGCFK